MSKDYIERGALLREDFTDMFVDPYDIEIFESIIENAPAADVVEVKHGRMESGGVDEWYTNYYTCMECGASMMLTDADCYHIAPKFCANCGARMDGE